MKSSWTRWATAVPLFGLLFAVVATGAPPIGGREVAEVAVVENSRTRLPALATSKLAPPKYERDVARLVARMLEGVHYTGREIDDELSKVWFNNYIDQLDYQRIVFLQSDIDAFRERFELTMDDAISKRPADVESAVVIYETYRRRMQDRLEAARQAAAGPVDLTDDERWSLQRHDRMVWPATDEEANDLWRKRVEDDFIVGLLDKQEHDEIKDRLLKRYERIQKSLGDTESTDVMESWLTALGRSYDPHSQWFAPARNDDFNISITNSVTGIGAQLRTEGDYTEIVEIITGGPAFTSKKLKPEDKILAVAQGDKDFVDILGLRIDKVVSLIRGEVGTKVRLQIQHADGAREIVSLIRERVTLEASAAASEIKEVGGRKLGVVTLPSFYVDPNNQRDGRRASADVKAALKDLRAKGAQGLVLDLRDNGGGSLIEAIDVAGLFITSGPVVQIRERNGMVESLPDRDPQVHWLDPVVVLTSPTSASASEIVAGALQDYGRAVVVGSEQTHGKGTVQSVAPLDRQLPANRSVPSGGGGALKVTIQKFYRVSGASTQRRGVRSDVVLPSHWDGLEVYESDLDHALAWDRIPPAPAVRVADLGSVLPQLKEKSAARVTANKEFDELSKFLDQRNQMQDAESISLSLETRKKEFELRKELRDAAEHGGQDAESDEEAADFVLDEALAVLNDLVELAS